MPTTSNVAYYPSWTGDSNDPVNHVVGPYGHQRVPMTSQPAIDADRMDFQVPIITRGEYVARASGLSIVSTNDTPYHTVDPRGTVTRFGQGNWFQYTNFDTEKTAPICISSVMLAPFMASSYPLPGIGVGNPDLATMESAFLLVQKPAPDIMNTLNTPIPGGTGLWMTASTNPLLPGFDYRAVSIPPGTGRTTSGPKFYDFAMATPKDISIFNTSTRAFEVDSASVFLKNHNGPYALSQFGANKVSFRLVSAGLKIKYTGTEEERGGLVTSLEHPEHTSLVGFTLPEMQAFDYARTEAVMANKWHSLMYSGPVNDNEAQFTNNPVGTPFMAITVSGGSNLSFQTEGWANYEFAGDEVRDKIVICMDEAGGVAVAAAAKNLQSSKNFGEGSGKKLLKVAHSMITKLSGVS